MKQSSCLVVIGLPRGKVRCWQGMARSSREYPGDGLEVIFERRFVGGRKGKVQSGLNTFARDLKYMELLICYGQ